MTRHRKWIASILLCDREQIDVSDLPIEIRQPDAVGVCFAQPAKPSRRGKGTKTALLDLLAVCDWNKAEVGRRLGVSHTAIWKSMKKYEIPLRQQE